jgi:hypothetical protein
MSPNEIFKRALEMGTEAYQKQNRLKWGISVCATEIKVGQDLILGINWGGGSISDNTKYESQKTMPVLPEFKRELKSGDYRFLLRTKDNLKTYAKIDVEAGDFNYTNLCLFRSPNQKDLLAEDYVACYETFKFLVREIAPPRIISLGTTNINKMKAVDPSFACDMKSSGKAKGYKGNLLSSKFYGIPHPNARLSNNDRNDIWKDIFSD